MNVSHPLRGLWKYRAANGVTIATLAATIAFAQDFLHLAARHAASSDPAAVLRGD